MGVETFLKHGIFLSKIYQNHHFSLHLRILKNVRFYFVMFCKMKSCFGYIVEILYNKVTVKNNYFAYVPVKMGNDKIIVQDNHVSCLC